MKLSKLFTKTSKTFPSGEESKNAQLLIKAGFVYKEMAGVYAYLPLGLKVVENIKQIIREEMNAIDSNELIMTGLQRKEIWERTTRWSDEVVDIWFKTQLKDKTEVGLGWSHEEPIVEMLKGQIQSYKDLPVSLYQFQTKMRNELRAKSGIMRGREFLMKDLYSFHASKEDLENYYSEVMKAYQRVFARLGLGEETFVTFASGGSFTKFSHEFQTICEAGEDITYLKRDQNLAFNEEILDEALASGEIATREGLEKVKTAEVGNIFNFGTQKTDEMGLYFTDKDGQKKSVWMGSYGIGVTRVMGVIAENFSDEKGLIWPENVAPAKIYLVQIGEKSCELAEEIYAELTAKGVEVLFDDRDLRPGQKFADAELMGIPYRVTVSDRLMESGEFEIVARKTGEMEMISREQLMRKFVK
jgi:prolyl-tRNA synthetase